MAGYDCIIAIYNDLSECLTIDPSHSSLEGGTWLYPPPETIRAGEECTVHLQASTAAPTHGSDASVSYKINLPYKCGEWRVLFQFSNSPELHHATAIPTFTSAESVHVRCDLIEPNWTCSSTTSLILKGKLTIRYRDNLRTRSQVISVSIPKNSIGPFVRNSRGRAALDFHEGQHVIWHSDRIATYEDNGNSQVSGSFYPVAVDVTKVDRRILKLVIDIFEEELLGVPLRLYGDVDPSHEVVVSSQDEPLLFPTTGLHDVFVTVSPPWARTDAPWGIAGNVVWKLCVPETGQKLGLNFSRLEFYALQNRLPGLYQSNVVPVELMRWIVWPFRDTRTTWLQHCCNLTFQNFAFIYDTQKGKPSYHDFQDQSSKKSSFRIEEYWENIGQGSKVNCYDQASIMQICLGLSPNTQGSYWMLMNPFGAIRPTVLVGRGVCNNPFGDPIFCREDSPDRTGFINHAFIEVQGSQGPRIVDTCCGPHRGNENLDDFIKGSVDAAVTRWIAGTPDAARRKPGVVELTFVAARNCLG